MASYVTSYGAARSRHEMSCYQLDVQARFPQRESFWSGGSSHVWIGLPCASPTLARARVMLFITALVPAPRVPSYARISIWAPTAIQSELSVRYEVSHRTIPRRSRSPWPVWKSIYVHIFESQVLSLLQFSVCEIDGCRSLNRRISGLKQRPSGLFDYR